MLFSQSVRSAYWNTNCLSFKKKSDNATYIQIFLLSKSPEMHKRTCVRNVECLHVKTCGALQSMRFKGLKCVFEDFSGSTLRLVRNVLNRFLLLERYAFVYKPQNNFCITYRFSWNLCLYKLSLAKKFLCEIESLYRQ